MRSFEVSIVILLFAWFLPCTLVCAQTPFDAFSPETSRIILDGDSIAAWRAEQQSQLSHRRPTHSRPDTILCALIADLRNEQLLLVDIATHRPVAYAPFTDEIKNWLSVDPLVDKNITTSPYLYCNGNPIMLIDPDGMDDYSINENGEIQLFRKTDDNFDRLGTLANGDFDEQNFVKLNDKSLIPGFLYSNSRQDGNNYVVGKKGKEVAKFFLFAAKNSEVEWSMSGYFENGYRRYGVSTSHNVERVTSAYSALGIDERRLLFSVHSHGREDGTKGASTYDPITQAPNDMSTLYDMHNRFVGYNQNLPAFYVYHTYSGGLYNYTIYNSSIFIRTISSYNNGLNFLIPTR